METTSSEEQINIIQQLGQQQQWENKTQQKRKQHETYKFQNKKQKWK